MRGNGLNLQADVRVAWNTPGWSPAEHLRINSGVTVRRPGRFDRFVADAAAGWQAEAHYHGCYQPLPDWRPLTAGERAQVVGITDGDALHQTVQVFELPAALMATARSVARGSVVTADFDAKPLTGARQVRGPALAPLLVPLREWLAEQVCAPFEMGCDYGPFVRVNPPGRQSATGYEQRSWDGLHVDNWGAGVRRQLQRAYNGSRFVFNLGADTRHFICINLRLATMVQRHASDLSAEVVQLLLRDDCAMPGLLAAAFMERFPDYPVLRVTLPSGFGYVASSTSIPHDGYLAGMGHDDVALLLPHKLDTVRSGPPEPLRYHAGWAAACRRHTS